jgi:hypothetical protein
VERGGAGCAGPRGPVREEKLNRSTVPPRIKRHAPTISPQPALSCAFVFVCEALPGRWQPLEPPKPPAVPFDPKHPEKFMAAQKKVPCCAAPRASTAAARDTPQGKPALMFAHLKNKTNGEPYVTPTPAPLLLLLLLLPPPPPPHIITLRTATPKRRLRKSRLSGSRCLCQRPRAASRRPTS